MLLFFGIGSYYELRSLHLFRIGQSRIQRSPTIENLLVSHFSTLPIEIDKRLERSRKKVGMPNLVKHSLGHKSKGSPSRLSLSDR